MSSRSSSEADLGTRSVMVSVLKDTGTRMSINNRQLRHCAKDCFQMIQYKHTFLFIIATMFLYLIFNIYTNSSHIVENMIQLRNCQSISDANLSETCRIKTNVLYRKGKILVPKLYALKGGGQLGNQVYAILSFIGIARKLRRKPIIVLGDEFNHLSTPALWNLITHFPQMLKDVEVYKDALFYNTMWPTILIECADCFNDVVSLHSNLESQPVVILEATYLQNLQYLEFLPKNEIVSRLEFPIHAQMFLRDVVPERALQSEKRLCVHIRRTDFITNNHQYSDEDQTFRAVVKVVEINANISLSVVLFGDDQKFLEKFMDAERYSNLKNSTFIPYNGWGKFEMPPHFVWLFFKHHCDIILLTAPTSTFGFWGAWLADSATVFYIPVENAIKQMPLRWNLLTL